MSRRIHDGSGLNTCERLPPRRASAARSPDPSVTEKTMSSPNPDLILRLESQQLEMNFRVEKSKIPDDEIPAEYTIEMMTQTIIDMMEKGNLPPWTKPWRSLWPRNPYGRPYSGLNAFYLMAISELIGFSDTVWVTRKWAEKRNYTLIGPESRIVSLWFAPNREGHETPRFRSYGVFNREQCQGFNLPQRAPKLPISTGEDIISKYLIQEKDTGLELMFDKSLLSANEESFAAYYLPREDMICIPSIDRFHNETKYYTTAFHEMAHSTGSYKRLDRHERNAVSEFGSHSYGLEELVAEMTAAYLAKQSELPEIESLITDSASYLHNWLCKIKEDPEILWKSAGKSQQAFNYITDHNKACAKARERVAKRKVGI